MTGIHWAERRGSCVWCVCVGVVCVCVGVVWVCGSGVGVWEGGTVTSSIPNLKMNSWYKIYAYINTVNST